MEITPLLVMVEDETDLASGYLKEINIQEFLPQIAFVTDIKSLSDYILENKPARIYWVDVHLGPGRDNDGLEVIRLARTAVPDALIIVYTAFPEQRQRCLDAGANAFFLKGPAHYEENMRKIRNLIVDYLSGLIKTMVITEFYAQVAHIDEEDGWVKMECQVEGVSERFFPLELIEASVSGELDLDDCLFVRIIQTGNAIKIILERVDGIPGKKPEMFEPKEATAKRLLNSGIWNRKLTDNDN